MTLSASLQTCHQSIDIGNQIRLDLATLLGPLQKFGNDWTLVQNGLIKTGWSTRSDKAAKAVHRLRDFARTELNCRQTDLNADQELTMLHCFGFAL